MNRVAPNDLNYDDVLPLAVESKSQVRDFMPEGGSVYGPNGSSNPNICRIPVNADAMLDARNSYLRFKLNNTTASSGTLGLDFPQSFIKRVRISSGGVVLEDIDAYNRLYAGILYPTQVSVGGLNEATICSGQNQICLAAGTTPSIKVSNVPVHNANDQVASPGGVDMTVHLACGFLNLERYIPLVMMNAGFIIELEFDSAGSVGVGSAANTWTISDIRYTAHLIDLQRDFYDRLRMVMNESGGVLQLSGYTYRHFSGQWPSTASNATINIPARVKSIKSILCKQTIEADVSGHTKFGVSDGLTHGLTSYQFRIGSVVYPPTAIETRTGASATVGGYNAQAYQELRKSFGTLGNAEHGGIFLNQHSYFLGGASEHTGSASGAIPHLAPIGLDFESFRSRLENGINTADRSLPITLELVGTGGSGQVSTTVDAYVMADAIFYINMDGSASVSV